MEIELNLKGVNEVMKSPEIQVAVQAAGEAVAGAASGMSGESFAARTHLASWVAISNVYPDSAGAARANFRQNVIEKGVGSVGLPRSKR